MELQNNTRPELLAPAGDMEKLRAAVAFGADAVYLAGTAYGMRAAAACFTAEELPAAAAYCRERGVRVYAACNTIPNDNEMRVLPAWLEQLDAAGIDAVIAADLGVLRAVQKYAPRLHIHISTQAGVMNSETAEVFYDLGASRVVLAREMSLEQIADLRAHTPPQLELEAFCHGAMCVSFSGRCTLSDYMAGRGANHGECAQPCRWRYHLIEEKRPGEYFEITEDTGGTYILNSHDMCMIEHIPALLDAGIHSLKIEGRTKSAYYAAAITNAYRHVLDAAIDDRPADKLWLREVNNVSHRPYSTGFYFGRPGQYNEDACYFSGRDVVAIVEGTEPDGRTRLSQRNRFFPGDTVELLAPGAAPISFAMPEMTDTDGLTVTSANHPKMTLLARLPITAPAGAYLRTARTSDLSGHKSILKG